jgi:hypothetical protein
MYAWSVCMHGLVHVCLHVVHAFMYVRMYLYVSVRLYAYMHSTIHCKRKGVMLYVYTHLCIVVCMYAHNPCMHAVCVHVFVPTYAHIQCMHAWMDAWD